MKLCHVLLPAILPAILVVLALQAVASAQPLPKCAAVGGGAGSPLPNDPREILLLDSLVMSFSGTPEALPSGMAIPACSGTTVTTKKEITINRTGCDALFDPAILAKGKVQISGACVLHLEPFSGVAKNSNDEGITPVLKGSTVELSSLKLHDGQRVVFVYKPGDKLIVESAKVTGTSVTLKQTFLDPNATVVYWIGGDGQLTSAKLKGEAKEPPKDDESDPGKGDRLLVSGAAEQPCKDARSRANRDRYNVLCVAADDQAITLQGEPSDGTIMRPNRSIMVVLVHPKGTQYTVTVDGDLGIFAPGILDQTVPDKSVKAHAATADRAPIPAVVDTRTFGPRLPGKASVRIKPASAEQAKKQFEVVVELLVETTYSGAVRVGIGGVFGGAVDRGYTTRTAPGGGQAEIVASNGGDMDVEIVAGASIFLDRGGRGYASPDHNMKWGPYFGIGVLNQTEDGIKALQSVHLGLEYELNPHFSVALTFVGRKITRLASGFEVGAPVGASGVPMEKGYAFGWGIVVNLSPDFLRLATKSTSSFFGK